MSLFTGDMHLENSENNVQIAFSIYHESTFDMLVSVYVSVYPHTWKKSQQNQNNTQN